ncbi:MAG: FAD-dependent monooxygenase [Saprospiraceae bacterium]|nr:FAD-dependent monooxygenase [Saprospiraceae bacterium]
MSEKIVIVGAGLCGAMMGLRLAQKGFKVSIYERRPDMRKVDISAGRSINLALSDRGLKGLEMVGLREKVAPLIIPMYGRMIHPMDGEPGFYAYSGRKGECINSISRGGLNMLLLDEAEKTGLVDIQFDTECLRVDFETGEVRLRNNEDGMSFSDTGIFVLGTDGAASAVRRSMSAISGQLRFDFSQKFLDTGYKELSIPPDENGGFRIEKNALHIWPRNGFMMIALPNLDGSFTVTLFMPFEGEVSFEMFKNDTIIDHFFKTQFSEAYRHMPELIDDFHNNPASSLGTVKCWPWQVNGKSTLMGDAAHAVVPFYGQGMNASFEDCVILDECIDQYGPDWTSVLKHYQESRKPNADAIADLAEDNFYEMRDATADPVFNLKRKIELQLEQRFPEYYSKYSMVTFREDLPYETAMIKGRKQDAILMDFAAKAGNPEDVDFNQLMDLIKEIG